MKPGTIIKINFICACILALVNGALNTGRFTGAILILLFSVYVTMMELEKGSE